MAIEAFFSGFTFEVQCVSNVVSLEVWLIIHSHIECVSILYHW